MGIKFHKSVKISKGSRINISKSGVGFSTGTKGARASFGPSGTRTTFTAPGTGLSYESRSGKFSSSKSTSDPDVSDFVFGIKLFLIVLVIAVVLVSIGMFLLKKWVFC